MSNVYKLKKIKILTKGRAYSMNRLDQLAQPVRRYGEHIRAILERERREQMEYLDETESLGGGRRIGSAKKLRRSTNGSVSAGNNSAMSRSMTHLTGAGNVVAISAAMAASTTQRGKYSLGGGISSNFRPLGHSRSMDASKSMTHLTSNSNGWSTASNSGGGGTPRLQTAATKKYLQNFSNASSTTYSSTLLPQSSSSPLYNNLITTTTTNLTSTTFKTKRGQTQTQTNQQRQQQQQHQQYQQQKQQQQQQYNSYQFNRFDPNSLLLMNSSSLLLTAGVCAFLLPTSSLLFN